MTYIVLPKIISWHSQRVPNSLSSTKKRQLFRSTFQMLFPANDDSESAISSVSVQLLHFFTSFFQGINSVAVTVHVSCILRYSCIACILYYMTHGKINF